MFIILSVLIRRWITTSLFMVIFKKSENAYFSKKSISIVRINYGIIVYIPKKLWIFIINKLLKQMSQRRSWTEEEDKVLKYLKDILQVKKWSEISRKMEFQYNLPGRNGKQCRERYTNHLDSSIISKEFTIEEQEKLFKLHDQIGNKWSLICKQFIGRTDNHIKNHFHSKLRKAIRKLNKQIKINFKKTAKPYKLNLIYKIVESSDYRFGNKTTFTEQNLKFFNDLKNSLLQYAGGNVQRTELSSMKDKQQSRYLISQLQVFEKFLKSKKLNASTSKIDSNTEIFVIPEEVKRSSSTSNSQCSSNIQIESLKSEDEQSFPFYDEVSFQFVCQENLQHRAKGSKYDQIKAQNKQNISQQRDVQLQIKSAGVKNYYSFLNIQKQCNQTIQTQNILNNLIEQTELPPFGLEKRLSIKSFQSLQEYDDSCLNDSQVHMMLRKFDNFSNIQVGLFQ